MQNAIEVIRASVELGFTTAQVKALLKKKGFKDSDIESALLETGLANARRETFRTEFERALIAAIVANGNSISESLVKETFEKAVSEYYPLGSKDPKASNTIRHTDYYCKTYGNFATELLVAIAVKRK